jgi:hypothetical protein
VHGDPVFTNIIFGHQSVQVKFIDPRGSFCAACGHDAPMDAMYDFAKVYQSLAGYDTILAGHQEVIRNRTTESGRGNERDLALISVLEEHVAMRYRSAHARALPHLAATLVLSILPLHPRELAADFVAMAYRLALA